MFFSILGKWMDGCTLYIKRQLTAKCLQLMFFRPLFFHQAEDQTFTFPNIFPEKDQTPVEGSLEEMQNKFMEDEKQRQKFDPRRGGVTEWFGL